MVRILGAFILFFSIVGCDQATKVLVRENLEIGDGYSYLFDTVRIEHAENTGAFLSLGAKLPEAFRFWFFNVAVGLLLTAVAIYLIASAFSAHKRLPVVTGMALILFLAGGLGNLIDRVRFGAVTDFLIVGYGSLSTGIFNIADFAIVAGVALMLFPTTPRHPTPVT